jgi:hypothetical protein
MQIMPRRHSASGSCTRRQRAGQPPVTRDWYPSLASGTESMRPSGSPDSTQNMFHDQLCMTITVPSRTARVMRDLP